MKYKLMKVFDVCDFPQKLKQQVGDWFSDLNCTATKHTVEFWTREEALANWGQEEDCDPLDTYLIKNGAENGENVILIYDW